MEFVKKIKERASAGAMAAALLTTGGAPAVASASENPPANVFWAQHAGVEKNLVDLTLKLASGESLNAYPEEAAKVVHQLANNGTETAVYAPKGTSIVFVYNHANDGPGTLAAFRNHRPQDVQIDAATLREAGVYARVSDGLGDPRNKMPNALQISDIYEDAKRIVSNHPVVDNLMPHAARVKSHKVASDGICR